MIDAARGWGSWAGPGNQTSGLPIRRLSEQGRASDRAESPRGRRGRLILLTRSPSRCLVAASGATLPAVGVVRLLADVGLLPDLRYVSSVSGGSVANGMIAVKWPEL